MKATRNLILPALLLGAMPSTAAAQGVKDSPKVENVSKSEPKPSQKNAKEIGPKVQSRTEITLENLDSILKTEKPLILYVNATWCPQCKIFDNTLDDLKALLGENIEIASLTVDLETHPSGEVEQIAQTLNLNEEATKAFPTTLIRKRDGHYTTVVGKVPLEELLRELEGYGVKPKAQALMEMLKKKTKKTPTILQKFLDRGIYDPEIIGLDDNVDEALKKHLIRDPEAALKNPDLFRRIPNFENLLDKAERTEKNNKLLIDAIQNDDSESVKKLIKNGTDPNEVFKKGQSLLAIAIMGGKNKMVGLLLENGTNPNAKDPKGTNPIIYAIANKNTEAVRLLLKSGAGLEAPNNDNVTPLMLAAVAGLDDIMSLFLDAGANLNTKDKEGSNVLTYAVISGKEQPVRLLLGRKGLEINSKNISGTTPLMVAAQSGNEAVVKMLIEKGADVNVKNNKGLTPLTVATRSLGMNSIIPNLLIEKGANVNVSDASGATPLMNASSQGNIGTVRLLLAKGADIKSRNVEGATPLMYAVSAEGSTEDNRLLMAVQKVLKDGNLPKEDQKTMTELINMLEEKRRNRIEIVNLLIGKGADLNARSKEGLTALIIATFRENIDSVRLLIGKGADLNARSKEGLTALMIAKNIGNDEIIRLLEAKTK